MKGDTFWSFEHGFEFCKQAAVFYSQCIHSFANDLLSAYCSGAGAKRWGGSNDETDETPALMALAVAVGTES